MTSSRLLLSLCLVGVNSQKIVKILPLGDSITWGAGSTAQPPDYVAAATTDDGGYRAPLYFSLLSAGWPNSSFTFVGSQTSGPAWFPAEQRHHEGHPGWTTAQVASIWKTWTAFQADVTLVHLGTNDIHEGRTTSEMIADMNNLLNITFTQTPNTAVLLATIISRGTPQWVPNVTAYNDALPAVVDSFASQGHNITLVDMNARTGMCAMANPAPGGYNRSDCCQDRVHPTAGGYSILAGVWFEYLRDMFFVPPNTQAGYDEGIFA